MMPHEGPDYAFGISGAQQDGHYCELGRTGRIPPHQYQKPPHIWDFPGSSPSLHLWFVLFKGRKRNQGWRRRGLLQIWDYPALLRQCLVRWPHRNAECRVCVCTSHLRNAQAQHRIPGCHLGFAGRAAGSCEEQSSGFAQQHDNPWTHFLHPCSQRDRTTFQQTPARPHCFDQLPWSNRAGSGFSLAVVTDACEISLGQAEKYSA